MSTQQNNFKAIASAIRAKDGTAAKIPAKEFASRILNIPTNRLPSGVYTINAISNNTALGSVTGGGYASAGFTANLTAKRLQTKSKFDGWYENGSLLNDKEKYSFTVQKDRNIVGMFSKMQFQGKWYTADTLPAGSKTGLAYGDGVFLYASPVSKTNYISTDGVNWETIESSAVSSTITSPQSKMIFQNGIFAIIDLTYYRVYFTDDRGLTWRTSTIYTNLGNAKGLTAGNGYFLVSANMTTVKKYLFKSTDCKTWTLASFPSSLVDPAKTTIYGCRFAEGLFFVPTGAGLLVSPDLENWQLVKQPFVMNDVAYGNGKYVAVNNLYYSYSTDGYNWSEKGTFPVSNPANVFNSIAYGEGVFVVVNNTSSGSSVSFYSDDGVTWKQAALPAAAKWKPVVFGGDKFVTVTQNSAAYLV